MEILSCHTKIYFCWHYSFCVACTSRGTRTDMSYGSPSMAPYDTDSRIKSKLSDAMPPRHLQDYWKLRGARCLSGVGVFCLAGYMEVCQNMKALLSFHINVSGYNGCEPLLYWKCHGHKKAMHNVVERFSQTFYREMFCRLTL